MPVPVFLLAAMLSTAESAEPPHRLFAEQESTADVLRAMDEPPIGKLPPGDQVFRFLWLRSFHRPMLVQLEKHADVMTVLLKALDSPWSLGPDGVHVGTLAVTQRKRLLADSWDRLADRRRIAFWGKPSYDPAAEVGVDGAFWILEGRSWGQYHIVERWTPTDGSFREMCLTMLGLAGVDLPHERVY